MKGKMITAQKNRASERRTKALREFELMKIRPRLLFHCIIIAFFLSYFRSGDNKSERKNLSPNSEQRLSTMKEEEEHTDQIKKSNPHNLSQV